MNESDFIKVGNLTKFKIAETILRDVLAGAEYGVSEVEYQNILSRVTNMIDHLFSVVKCVVDENNKR